MISYKDMSFCVGPCDYLECDRNAHNIPKFPNGEYNTDGLPVAFCDFRRECKDYLIPRGAEYDHLPLEHDDG